MKTLALRVDATSTTGLGHLTRCLALAAVVKASGWRVIGIGNVADVGMRDKALSIAESWHGLPETYPNPVDLTATLAVLGEIHADWIILDGYVFDLPYQRALRNMARLLVLDDGPRLPVYSADLLLDQNLGAESRRYGLEGAGKALLGRRYVLLRPSFLERQGRKHPLPEHAVRVLVTLGGVVEPAALMSVFLGLEKITSPLDVVVLTGTASATMAWARTWVDEPNRWPHNVRLLSYYDDMPGLMDTVDVAISAAGSTSWELAFMGVPMLLIVLAGNQTGVANALATAGAAIDLGGPDVGFPERLSQQLNQLINDLPRRQELSFNGQSVVDGRGAERVLEAMQQ